MLECVNICEELKQILYAGSVLACTEYPTMIFPPYPLLSSNLAGGMGHVSPPSGNFSDGGTLQGP